jgi:predicted nucleotidyltransferase
LRGKNGTDENISRNYQLTADENESILNGMETTAIQIDLMKVKAYLREKEELRKQKSLDELKLTAKKLGDLGPTWKKYNIKKVYLYGSLTVGSLHSESDIDIAVEGNINYQQLLELWGEVDRRFTREVDVRSLEELPFKETVRKKGMVVYDE